MLADECREAQKVKGTNDTSQTILGYEAYFGTYTVNEKEGIVTHHLESALFPGDIGWGQCAGPELRLSSEPY
jgi:hypothetical protein